MISKADDITTDVIKSYIEDNLRRSEIKYNHFSNVLCPECHAILDFNTTSCPNCGCTKLAALFTDKQRDMENT